jgi:hypothetical protein
MKNVIILFLTAFLSFSLSSQSLYNKMLVADTTIWQHFNCYIPVIAPSSQPASPNFGYFPVIAMDTITLNTGKYKKLYEIPGFSLNYSNKQLRGYMREDTIAKKVFFKETLTGADVLLYNFSLNIGDSALYTFPNFPNFNGYYRLDSIKTKIEMCGPRKHFYLWKHSSIIFPGSVNYLEHIESIGSKFHAMYNYNFNPSTCIFNTNSSQACYHPWELGLACKSDNKSKKYQSCTISLVNPCIAHYDSCNYGTVCSGIRNYKLNKDVTIYPNPTKNKLTLTINLEAIETVNIRVFDIAGNGVYSVIIENQRFKNSYPIVIQN